MSSNNLPQTRIEVAPQPTQPIVSGEVLQVELADNETVEWQWTHFATQSKITGYVIVKQQHPEQRQAEHLQ